MNSLLKIQIEESQKFLFERIPELKKRPPRYGFVLGSGLGEFSRELDKKYFYEIPFSEIPHFKITHVQGHSGTFIYGYLKGTSIPVVLLKGRVHYYEGHSPFDVVYGVRLLHSLGIKEFILTNAAGGINTKYRPGDLILVNDHMNFTGNNPLIGKNLDDFGERFPDMSHPYSPRMNERFIKASKKISYELLSGVYMGVSGPSYETPAEIRAFRILGADLVGMSTVYEVIALNHLKAEVVCLSCVTNMGAGILNTPLSHHEIKDVADQSLGAFTNLIHEALIN